MPDLLLNPVYTPPVGRLPVELLDEIFRLCFPRDSHLTLLDDPLKPSRVVSQVCNRWRTVALSNSRLWNEIALLKWRTWDYLSWVKELLHRSRKTPVSLRLWIGNGWDEHWDVVFEPLLLELIPRIRVLEVRMDYALLDEADNLITGLSGNNAPMLESVRIVPYNICRTGAQDSDFHFTSSMPKLKRVEYDLHFDYFPLSSLSNVTYCKMSFFLRYGGPEFSPDLCLELLRSMPLLQDLNLFVESTPEDEDNSTDSRDPLGVTLPHLKHLQMSVGCFYCVALIPYINVGPECTLDVTCTDSDIAGAHQATRLVLEAHFREGRLLMSDKILEIDIQPASICLMVHSAPPIPGVITRPLFVFNTTLKFPDGDSDEEEADGEPSHTLGIQPIQYALLMLIVRAVHKMKLTQASGISLNIDVPLPIERFSAAVLGPLLRACKSAKTLRLTGTKNAFMLPFLLSRIYGTGGRFDELLFSNLDDSDNGWDAGALMELSFKGDVTSNPEAMPPWPRNPGSEALKTVTFLHTNFDMTTLEGQCLLVNLLHWREQQIRVVDNLLWPVTCSTDLGGGLVAKPLTVTMADLMLHYLKCTRNAPVD